MSGDYLKDTKQWDVMDYAMTGLYAVFILIFSPLIVVFGLICVLGWILKQVGVPNLNDYDTGDW